jgi:hypothetical protein
LTQYSAEETMLKKFKKLLNIVLGGNESFSLENRLFLSTVVIGISVSLLGFIISLIISSSATTLIATLFIYYYLRLFPEFNDKDEVTSVLGVSRDITILKQSEIKLVN